LRADRLVSGISRSRRYDEQWPNVRVAVRSLMQATPSTRSPRARSIRPIDHADARAIATDPQVVRQSSHTRTTIGLLKHTAAEAAAFPSTYFTS
jgi:hypothetical protein